MDAVEIRLMQRKQLIERRRFEMKCRRQLHEMYDTWQSLLDVVLDGPQANILSASENLVWTELPV